MIPFISFSYKKKEITEKIIKSIKGIVDSEKYVLGDNILSFETNSPGSSRRTIHTAPPP